MLMQPRWALTFRMLTFSVPTFAKDTGLPLGWTIKRWVKLSFGGKWKAVGGLFDLRREPQHVQATLRCLVSLFWPEPPPAHMVFNWFKEPDHSFQIQSGFVCLDVMGFEA